VIYPSGARRSFKSQWREEEEKEEEEEEEEGREAKGGKLQHEGGGHMWGSECKQ